MGPLGVQETIFIFVLALLIFGPKKLPELGRTVGKAMTEFRRASSELRATFDREMNAIERETDLKTVAQEYNSETSSYDSYYDSGAYGSDNGYDTYGTESNESTAETSTESASAPQGAETTADENEAIERVADASMESRDDAIPETAEPNRDSQPVKS